MPTKTYGEMATQLSEEANKRNIPLVDKVKLMTLALELFPPDPYKVLADVQTDLDAFTAYVLVRSRESDKKQRRPQ